MTSEPMIHCGSISRSYEDLHQRAARIATGLSALGVGPGDRVALVLRNDVAYVEITMGVGLLGAVPVPVNWHWRHDELAYLITDSGSRVVFAHDDLVPGVEAVLPAGATLIRVPVTAELVAAYGLESARGGSGSHPELEGWLAAQAPWSSPRFGAPMALIYTSGTTGRPKGILREPMTSPEQNQALLRMVFEALGLTPQMRTLVPGPLYHTAPNVYTMLCAAAGMDMTIMPCFDAEETLRLVEERRINHILAVPTMLVRLLRLPEQVRRRYDTSLLQTLVHAAAPCPPEVKRQTIDWLGPVVREFYGGSETGAVTYCDSAEWLAHPGTVGRPVADATLRIYDDGGNPLPPGETGVVYVTPPTCWPRFTYLGNEAMRASIERDGYITVGDIGHLDADDFLYLSGRVSDMVISGGVNIYPAEIEECLLGMPGVRDVAVFGIPDEEYGEALAAHVDADPVAELREEDVRAYVHLRLASYKTPKLVVFDNELPREDSGKLFKRLLQQRYSAAASS